MKRPIGCLTFFLMIGFFSTAQDSINAYTGTYRAVADSNFIFNVKTDNQRLMLELPGQGQTVLQPQGKHRFKPEQVQPETIVEFLPGEGGEMQFHWIQSIEAVLVKQVDSTSRSTGYPGKYQLKNNPYVVIDIKEEGKNIIVKQGSGEPLLMRPVATNEFEYEKDGFRLHYSFVNDGREIQLKRTGPQVFVRRQSAVNELYAGRDFTKRRDFTRDDSLQGYLYPERSCYNVLFYSLDVRVLPETKSVSGHNTIRFKVVKPFQRMQVDLFQSMKIERLLYHNQPLSYTREYNAVFISLPKTLQPGTVDSITIHYGGQPRQPDLSKWQGGFFWLHDKNGSPWIQSVCQGSGASLWWPCKDHLSDEPDSMRIAVTVPDSLTEISNGKLLGMTPMPGKLMRYEWYVHYPINIYNVTVNLGKFDHYSEKYVNGRDTMPLHFYYLSYHDQLARKVFKGIQPMLRLYEKKFGKYPFAKDGFTIMESLYPMEHQGAVSVGSFSEPLNSDKYDTANLIRLAWHEAAHEWWGNNVSCKDNADIWMHEAFATYAEVLCLEAFQGKDAAIKYLRKEQSGNHDPLIGAYNVNDFHLGDVYSKGPHMLHTLRKVIDDDAKWFALLKDIQQQFKYKTISSKELETYISQKTGRNLQPFFDQYLRHKALPQVIFKFKPLKNGVDLNYKWKTDVAGFNMPIKINVGYDDRGLIYPTTTWKTIRLLGVVDIPITVNKDDYYIQVTQKK